MTSETLELRKDRQRETKSRFWAYGELQINKTICNYNQDYHASGLLEKASLNIRGL